MQQKMKLFHWHGLNSQGEKEKGVLVASNAQSAKETLHIKGVTRIRLQQNWQLSSKPKAEDIADLFQQFAILLNASIPLKTILQSLQEDCQNIELYQWLCTLSAALESGLSLSEAIDGTPNYLSLQERQLILVGEMTGQLPQLCQQIAQHKKDQVALKRKIQKILLYPSLVLGIALTLTVLLLIFIVPQFVTLYSENQAQLPTFTRILLWLSMMIRQQSVWILLISGVIWAMMKFVLARQWQSLKARLGTALPVFGAIIRLSRLVEFSQSLGLMLQAGVPLQEALLSFLPKDPTLQKDPFHKAIERMSQGVDQGLALSHTVSGAWFPVQARKMLTIGEQSGQLGKMLQHIATNYQEKLEHQISLLSQMLEPLLMVVIGGLIGLIMLGMYLPIFNMGSLIQ